MSSIAAAFARAFQTIWDSPRSMVFFRNFGAVVIAAILCLSPEAGPNRFALAAFLVFGCIPAALWLERRYPVEDHAWAQPLFDLSVLVVGVHFVPQMWFPTLVIGLMIVQAPSVADSRHSDALYATFAALLTTGMTFAAWLHGVPDWQLPVASMIVLYPSIIYYSHRQRKRAEQVRERSRALEGLIVVAGGVAHDFNNMLAGVMGHAELALDSLDERAAARGPVEEALRGAQRASLLSARLLAFASPRDATVELLDLDEEVGELVALLAPVVPTGVSLELKPSGEAAWVRANRTSLQQVVMNLIVNAGEASRSPGDKVSVELELVDRRGASHRWVELRVIDRGVGISAELGAHLFEGMFTLKEHGHGLGLASARATVEESGGELRIESQEGVGTCVSMWLPAHAPPATRPAAGDPPAAAPPGGTALVVEDDPAVRAVLASMLRRLDYDVVEAGRGRDALERFRSDPARFDVVLLDLRLPDQDGWSCLAELRRVATDVPVVICSGHDPTDSVGNHDDPHLDFLPKPFRAATLREALVRVGPRDRS